MRTSTIASASRATQAARRDWARRAQAVGVTFTVTDCPYTDAELADLAAQGRRAAYLPPELARAADRPLLARIFPLLRCYAFLEDNPFPNDVDHAGWFDYEVAVDAALTDTHETDLEERLPAAGLRLLTLNEYAVASQDLHERTGHHLDERATWARIGTRVDGHLAAARFDGAEMAEGLGDEEPAEGSLLVAYDISAGDRVRILGARTSTSVAPDLPLPAATPVAPPRPRTAAPDAEFLGRSWRDTVDAMLAAGFHRELGLAADDYRHSLPRFAAQPEALRGRMDLPLLVETRIPWRRQAQLTGMRFSHGVRTSDVVDLDHAAEHRGSAPYATWCNDWGQRFDQPVAAPDARRRLAADELGATIAELVALQVSRPDLALRGRFFEAVGSAMAGLVDYVQVGEPRDRYPCLYHWRGQPELGSNMRPEAFAMFRPLVRATVTVRS